MDDSDFQKNLECVEQRAKRADPAFWWQAGDALFYAKYGGGFIVPAVLSGLTVLAFGAAKAWQPVKNALQRVGEKLPDNLSFLRRRGVSNLAGVAVNATVVLAGLALAAPVVLTGVVTATAVAGASAAAANMVYMANNAYNFLRSESGEEWLAQQRRCCRKWQDPLVKGLGKLNAPLMSAVGDVLLLFGAVMPHKVASRAMFAVGAGLSLTAGWWAGRELNKPESERRNVAIASRLLAAGTVLKGVSGLLDIERLPQSLGELASVASVPVASAVFAAGYENQARLDDRDYYRAQAGKRGLATPAV